jgi:hypothetical protein
MSSMTYPPRTKTVLANIARLKAERDELRAALQRLLRAFEADYEQVPDLQIRICWETNSMAIELAKAVLAKTEPKP